MSRTLNEDTTTTFGNLATTGTMTIAGATENQGALTVDSTLGVTGALTAKSSVVVSGLTELSGGLSVLASANNLGFSPYPVASVTAVVSTSQAGNSPTILASQAGVLTLSGSGAILTAALPTALSAEGGTYIFRNLDARAHILSCSQEVGGTTNIVSGSVPNSSRITMGASVGSSVTLSSDGLSWFVVAGRLGISGTV